jgi:hypothetical protein
VNCCILENEKISDHCTIGIKINSIKSSSEKSVKLKSIIKYSRELLIKDINEWNWNSMCDKIINENAEWMVAGMSKAVARMKCNENWIDYRNKRNRYKNVLRKQSMDFTRKKIQKNNKNSKKCGMYLSHYTK